MRSLVSIFFVFVAGILYAQTPQSFSYQAVARDNQGEVIANQNIGIRFSISRDQGGNDGTGLVVYKEQHEVMTNAYGLFNLNVGEGTPLFESFSDIDWGAGKYFVRTELDATGNGDYEPMGISPILSVPYALRAATVDDPADADADPTNELQVLFYNPINRQLFISDGNMIDLGPVDDADADPQNEIQSLSFNPDNQQLSLSGANSVDMSSLQSSGEIMDRDEQTLSLDGTTLRIENGNSVELSPIRDGVEDADADPSNELQTLDFSPATNTLLISGGNSVVLPLSDGGGGSNDPGVFERVSNTVRNRVNDQELDFIFGSPFIDFSGDPIDGNRLIFDGGQGAFRAGGSFEDGLDYSKGQFGAYQNWWNRSNLGRFSFAGGFANFGGGDYSTAFGRLNIVAGAGAFALGQENEVIGNSAGAFGRGLISQAFGTTVVGLYNEPFPDVREISYDAEDPIFIVGNGSGEDQRRNALTILKNGSTQINGRLVVANALGADPYGFPGQRGAIGQSIIMASQDSTRWGYPEALESRDGSLHLQALSDEEQNLEISFNGTPRFAFQEGRLEILNSSRNIFIGKDAGADFMGGQKNILIGEDAGNNIDFANENVMIGNAAGFLISTGSNNVMVGNNAGLNTRTGRANVFVGNGAGFNNNGSNNVFLGAGAGLNEFGSNKLIIEGLSIISSDALITGDFSADLLNLNARVGIRNPMPESTLHLVHPDSSSGRVGLRLENEGTNQHFWNFMVRNSDGALLLFSDEAGVDASSFVGRFDPATGIYSGVSDRRLKEQIEPLEPILSRVSNLPLYRYRMKNQVGGSPQIGVMAQDLAKDFPELTYFDAHTDRYSVNYSGLGILALKAVQEQQQTIEELKQENQDLRSELQALREMVLELKKTISSGKE